MTRPRRATMVSLFLAGCSSDPAGTIVVPAPDAATAVDAAIPAPDAAPPDAGVEHQVWTELTDPVIDVGGGFAEAPVGHGGDAGAVRISSRGALAMDPALPPALLPAMPSVPTGGTVLGAADLGADVTRDGTIRVVDAVEAGGVDAVRVITSTTGDIVVEGWLRGADLGTARQSLVLRAPAGTVFVTGIVDSGGRDGLADGDAAGNLEITARNVVIAGHVVATGERSETGEGGRGGAVSLAGADALLLATQGTVVTAGGEGVVRGGDGGALSAGGGAVALGGSIDTYGGGATGDGAPTGGQGGAIQASAGGDLDLTSTVRLRGGAAIGMGRAATGGAAATLRLDAQGIARVGAIVDARGGPAVVRTPGGDVAAGAGGTVLIGDATRPAGVEMRVPVVAIGGTGSIAGGNGGAVEVFAAAGDLALGAAISVDGGDSEAHPGDAGTLTGSAGPSSGGIWIAGQLTGVGGDAIAGATADGGTGAIVRLEVRTVDGDFTLAPTGSVVFDGGTASGAGAAGDGGDLAFVTYDGNASLAGQLLGRGGAALGADGTGGAGGIIEVFTDRNFDGIGGDLTVETTGVIDVSGGAGATGGSARNDGEGGVASFPSHQEDIAVLLNSDGRHGSPQDGGLSNLGLIVARGGTANGSGGDIMFHGRKPGSYEDPESGNVTLDGDGTGRRGDFGAE